MDNWIDGSVEIKVGTRIKNSPDKAI